MVWQQEQELLCTGCGQPRDLSMAKDRMFAYTAKPIRCHACAAASRARDKFVSQPHDPAGLTFSITDGGGNG